MNNLVETSVLAGLSVFIATAFFYLGISLWLLHRASFPEIRALAEKIDEYEKALRTKDKVMAAETQLSKHPDNFSLRASLVDILFRYFLNDKELFHQADAHARWIIARHPEKTNLCRGLANPYSGHRILPADGLKEIWESAIEGNPKNARILKNAGLFFVNLDTSFSIQCLQRALDLDPLDYEARSELARVTEFLRTGDSENDSKIYLSSFQHYRILCRFSWDADDFNRLEQVRKKYGYWLWPTPVAFFILTVHGLIHGPSWNNYSLQADAGTAALNSGNPHIARKYLRMLKKLLPAAEEANDWPPFLQVSYNLVARMAIIDNDYDTLMETLEKKASNPMDSEFHILFHDNSVIEDLVRAGKCEIAVNYIIKRAKEHVTDKGVAFQLDLLREGKAPFSKEKPPGFYDK